MTIDPNYIKDLRFVNNTFYYGCHMPVSNGIDKAILGIHNMGGNCLQIFVSNPMSGKVTDKAMQFYNNMQSPKPDVIYLHGDLEKLIVDNGGELSSGVSKNTSILIIKDESIKGNNGKYITQG